MILKICSSGKFSQSTINRITLLIFSFLFFNIYLFTFLVLVAEEGEIDLALALDHWHMWDLVPGQVGTGPCISNMASSLVDLKKEMCYAS